MRKSWIAVGVIGLVAVVLAWLLLPSPDTGGVIPERDRTQEVVQLRPPPGPGGALPAQRLGGGVEEELDDEGNPIPKPGHPGSHVMTRRSQPDAQAAGRASAPWSLVRRQLLTKPDEHKVLLDELASMIAVLRETRRNPDTHDFNALVVEQRALADKVRATGAASKDTEITNALTRLDEILTDYESEMAKATP